MADVLSQDEIDQLLSPVDEADLTFSLDELGVGFSNGFSTIESFEKYLTDRNHTPEKPYGIFDKDIAVCRFFDSGKNENLLEDIKRKNEEQGYGNINIPNTNITLINYSFCPNCKAIFSFQEVFTYYMNPKPDKRYTSKVHQYREDTRICCNNCGTYFLPSLIISDGTPRNEVQFLCRAQTIEAVEKYFSLKNMNVLTKNKSNIIQKGKLRAIKNDIYIKNLEERPTLITNILQYTPFDMVMNFIDGTNVEKGDVLFKEWKIR